MRLRSFILPAIAAMVLSHGALAATAPRTDLQQTPSGVYTLDPSHANVIWKISHMGFSYLAGRFDTIAGTLTLDSAKPENSKLTAEVNTASLNTHVSALDAKLVQEEFFNAKKFPKITFTAKRITLTGGNKGIIEGEVTLRGVTKPLSLDATLVGAGVNPYFNVPTLGFSALATLKRSDFGMNAYIPDVGDEVQLQIDAEFSLDKEATAKLATTAKGK